MQEKGYNAYWVYAVPVILASLVSLISLGSGLLFCMLNAAALILDSIVLRVSRREVFRRQIVPQSSGDKVLIPVIALCAIGSAALSAYDYAILKISALPTWTFLIGIVMLMTAYLIVTQCMRANPPHAAEKYGEEPKEGVDRGPYDVVRHPVMLAIILAGLSIPLILGSGIGFIPAALLIVAVIIHVAIEDDWRFTNYDWFYDYTKEVSYRIIPFIW